ncbi:MAG TPA: ATP-binding protein [Kofleriaceae bacterium]|jgi:signal transduction histidine kinase|nr:ATP-binding protein [Kofleriaceae bacterium]
MKPPAPDETVEMPRVEVEPVESTRDTIPPPLGTARLVCVAGADVGRSYACGDAPIVIGRSDRANIRVRGPDVSRSHARVSWHEGACVVEDLGSSNGTSVNGLAITRRVLRPGDRIQIGVSAIFVYGQADELEQRAVQLNKLETMSQVAAALVHDFRNLIGVIANSAEFCERRARERSPDDAELLETLADIRGAAVAATEVTGRLLDFARQRTPPPPDARVALRALVEEIVSSLRHTFHADTQVAIDIDPALEVAGERNDLHQLVLNLCMNSNDAMPAGGRLEITARARDFAGVEALARHLRSAGRYVELVVTDTGAGMDPATLGRVFEPFFTTKPQGTGLGLASVFGIVRNLGGSVVADSVPGRGTTMRVILPTPTAFRRAAPPTTPPPAGAYETKTVPLGKR